MPSPKKTATIREALRAKAGASLTRTEPAADQSAIAKGRQALTPRRKDIAAIQARARELYGVPSPGLETIPSVEQGFQFSALKSDDEFHFLQVEPLLEHTAVLLDRCSATRAEYDRLQIQRWKLAQELDRFIRLDEIRRRERQAGSDTIGYEQAVMETAAEKSLEENHANAESQLKALMDDLLASGFNKRMAARELTAWVSSYPLKDQELQGDDAVYAFDGMRKTKPDHLFDAARMETDEAAWEQVFSLMARRYQMAASSEAARLRKQGLELATKWQLADIALRGEREQVDLDAGWEKVYQAQCAGGVMNYGERIAPLQRRFLADFREALARLAAARRGLKDLYGYDPAFPQDGAPAYFEEIVTWAAQARQLAARFSALDQNYVLALSLKQLTKAQWETGRAASAWTFDIGEDLFPGQAHVRMRGLGVAVVGLPADDQSPAAQKSAGRKGSNSAAEEAKGAGFWSARIWLPPAATVKHASGAPVQMDQSALPCCVLGRVTARDAWPEPEMAGANIVHNASPIGKQWKLELSHVSTDGVETAALRDVQLYLHVAVRVPKANN